MSFFSLDPLPEINKPNSVSKWKIIDTEELYKANLKKHKISYGPDDIEYKLNNYGFRCDDFGDWNQHQYRVVFTGCSHTEGIGLPLEKVWAKQLHSIICKEFNITMPYWNVGVGGTGTDQMTRYFYNYKDILKPQVVISLMPEFSRREGEAGQIWNLVHNPIFDERSFISNEYIRYQTEKNFSMINLIMEEINSIFIFMSLEFNNLITDNDYTCIKQIHHSSHPTDYARDLIHWGSETHANIANTFFRESKKSIKWKLGL